MKYLQILILTVSFYLTNAQSDLYINSGSFVYADGSAFSSSPNISPIYITNDVNIANNGFLYLRNDAQLLQETNMGNTGTGKLSIYQTGTVNTYAYNYWASPVGNTDSNDSNNRPFRPNNNIYGEVLAPISSSLATYTSGYNGIASSPPTISSSWLYTYDPGTTYSEWDFLGESGNLASGYGFTMKGNPSEGQLYDFRGKPNNGDITVNVLSDQFTLVGNPYPSALDALDFIHDPLNNTITGTLKYWEQAPGESSHILSNYVGGYGTYTISSGGVDSFTHAPFKMYLSNGTPAPFPPLGSGTKVAKRYIPVGQGFMVKGSFDGSITFKNEHREFYKQTDPDSYFFKNSKNLRYKNVKQKGQYTKEGFNIVPSNFKRFRVNIGFDNNGVQSYTRQLLMNFHNTATNGFDYGLEGTLGKTEILNSDAYWIEKGIPYVIQAFSYNLDLRIPLIVNIETQQLVRFSIHDVQNFDINQSIYLHDIQNGSYINLQNQDYEIVLPPEKYTSRFEITFKSKTLSLENVINEVFLIYQDKKNSKLVISNPNKLKIESIALFDNVGKQIFNKKNLGNHKRYEFSTKNINRGLYVVKSTFNNNYSVNKKVILY